VKKVFAKNLGKIEESEEFGEAIAASSYCWCYVSASEGHILGLRVLENCIVPGYRYLFYANVSAVYAP
jgi:hypothetical protein